MSNYKLDLLQKSRYGFSLVCSVHLCEFLWDNIWMPILHHNFRPKVLRLVIVESTADKGHLDFVFIHRPQRHNTDTGLQR